MNVVLRRFGYGLDLYEDKLEEERILGELPEPLRRALEDLAARL